MQQYKVGIFCESELIPAWLDLGIQGLLGDDSLELHFIIEEQEPENLLWEVYEKLNNQIFTSPANAFKLKKLNNHLSVFHKTDGHYLQKDVEGNLIAKELPEFDLNVLTHGNGIETALIPEEDVLFLFNPNCAPVKKIGVIEYLQEADSVEIAICHLKKGNSAIDCVYHTRSINKYLSPYISRNISFWKVAAALQPVIQGVRLGSVAHKKNDKFCTKQNENSGLGLSLLLNLVLKQAKKNLRRMLDRILFIEQWILLVGKTKTLTGLDINRLSPYIPPKERIWADPNIVHSNGHYHLFFEEISEPSTKGHIAMSELMQDNSGLTPQVVLKKDYHLSNPFIFEVEGEYYMVPETNENNAIQLYKSSEWPCQWEFQQTLINNVKAVDSILHFWNDKWWLFTNISRDQGIPLNDELFLFYSDDLLTKQWVAHPQNPIVSDVSKARPAGKIIARNGELFRPSQDCSKRYGSAINLNRITVLDEERYEERAETYIAPPDNSPYLGTHTLNFEGDVVVMDAIMKKSRFF